MPVTTTRTMIVAAALALTACTSNASETEPAPAMETSVSSTPLAEATPQAQTTTSPTGNRADYLAGYQLAYIWSDDYGSRQKEVVGFCPDGSFYLYDSSMSSYTDG